MEFCPKCGALLVQKLKNAGCPRCGYASKSKANLTTSEKMTEKSKEVAVISKKDSETLPVVEAKCDKCGHKKAHFWTMQTRGVDEAETKFFKCAKCENTWRDYD